MRLLTCIVLAGVACAAPPVKSPPKGAGANDLVSIQATGYFDRNSVKELLGMDAGESILVVDVSMTPAAAGKWNLNRDDFILRSDRNGQRSQAATPSQIAGSAVMVVSSTGGQQGSYAPDNRRRPYGIPGIPGTGRTPPSLPDPNQRGGGAATADTSSAKADIDDGSRAKGDSPLLKLLKEKVLPEGERTGPVSGLLYFIIEGKQRPKDMEFIYKNSAGRIHIRFK